MMGTQALSWTVVWLTALIPSDPDGENPRGEANTAHVAQQTMGVSFLAEVGFLGALRHTVQSGDDGTKFNYVRQGGQDVLFPFLRLASEVWIDKRQGLVFLYQPLNLVTREVLRKDLIVDDVTFPKGTSMDLRYGFSFWRLSYLWDFREAQSEELALGVSLQFRNAVIDFSSADGALRQSNRDIGPVPILKGRYRTEISPTLWFGAEVDGFWAPIKYINGGESDVEGAIVDFSMRVGTEIIPTIDGFLNLRYLAGGASGTSDDGFSENWLQFVTLSIGVST